MKTILKKLYFEPDNFTGQVINPITFDKGINFVIGEGSDEDKETGEKMNSVGKSLSIEMINFCLFKDLAHSRVAKIPVTVMSDEVYVCLDVEIERQSSLKNVTIKRCRNDQKVLYIIVDGNEKEFSKLDEAKEYLEFLFFTEVENRPSLRNFLSLLIRDEKTSYDSIIKSSHGVRNFSDLIKPHLYLFGFDISKIDEQRKNLLDLSKIKKTISNINQSFKIAGINVKDIKSYINELQDKVEKLELSIEELKPSEGIEQRNDEYQKLLSELDDTMAKISAKKYAIDRIKSLPKVEEINVDDLKIIYNQYQLGLGDFVKRSIEQVITFKEEIDSFQSDLMTKKLIALQSEKNELETRRSYLDNQLAKIYESRNAKKKLEALKDAVSRHAEKNSKLANLSEKYRIIEDERNRKKLITKAISNIVDEIDAWLFSIADKLNDFENDLKEVHKYIAGNKECHFNIQTKPESSEFVEIDYRVNLDGGTGVNHIRTFIYDVLLLLNKYTSKKHLGFLIHDNIFAGVGLDDMVRSLNFLDDKQKKGADFQYIVTINKDEFDSAVSKFNFDYKQKVKATFKRNDQFLKISYREV